MAETKDGDGSEHQRRAGDGLSVLVLSASKYGSNKGVAERIAITLQSSCVLPRSSPTQARPRRCRPRKRGVQVRAPLPWPKAAPRPRGSDPRGNGTYSTAADVVRYIAAL